MGVGQYLENICQSPHRMAFFIARVSNVRSLALLGVLSSDEVVIFLLRCSLVHSFTKTRIVDTSVG
jgi:hypothetical protein